MRDLLIVMTKAAGLPVRREPHDLLRDNKEEKPADLCIDDWTIGGIAHSRQAIDLTCPLSDSSWSSLTVAEKRARADNMGSAGLAREEYKKGKIGDHASRLLRDNDLTMEARCDIGHIRFWPIGLEGDGTPTLAFEQFFNNVCGAAVQIKNLNRQSFKTYFQSRIANTLAQASTRNSLSATSYCRAKIINQSTPAIFGRVDDDDLVVEPQTSLPAYVSRRVPMVSRYVRRAT